MNTTNQFRHPTTILICGPTQCGKTHFTIRMIEEKIINPEPEHIIWAYGKWQDSYFDLASRVLNIEFVNGIEELHKIHFSPRKRNLLILDDLMLEAGKSDKTTELFTRGSHHDNLTIIYLVQNLFHRGQAHRDCSLNSHYIVIFDNPRDRNQIATLGRQMYPDGAGGKFLRSALADACSIQPHGYLLIDLRTDTADAARVKTKIFQGEETLIYKQLE